MRDRPELLFRARKYCEGNGLILGLPLGAGVHGSVFAVENQTEKGHSDIKVHERERDYCRERDVYRRLLERAVTASRGCTIPELLACDDVLWVIQMTIVTRPFVLDFAGVYLGKPPDFSEETLAEWTRDKQEQFGPRWSEVQAILRSLQGHGIYLMDVNPGNIAFAD